MSNDTTLLLTDDAPSAPEEQAAKTQEPPPDLDLSELQMKLIHLIQQQAQAQGGLLQLVSSESAKEIRTRPHIHGAPDRRAAEMAVLNHWLARARDSLQEGFMFLERAIVRPQGF